MLRGCPQFFFGTLDIAAFGAVTSVNVTPGVCVRNKFRCRLVQRFLGRGGDRLNFIRKGSN